MKYSELIKTLENAGCYIKRNGGNHDWYYSPSTEQCFPVGRHKTQDVPKGTLNNILTKAGLK